MQFLTAFLTGGAICVLGQLLIDKTALTPARILTAFVVAGVALGALGLYQPLVAFAGEGAAVPISPDGAGRARRAARGRRSRHTHRRRQKRGGRHCGGNRLFALRGAVLKITR